MERLERDLNKIISEALWSPSSDPLYENLICQTKSIDIFEKI
jgi:hypothetical protein